MSEFGGGGGGGAAAPPKADAPPRPTIALPPRSSYENLFRGSASGAGGGAADASPGPMTLVSSFFAEYPDNDCNSFSQLLAGAMSPIAPAAAPVERSDSAEGDGGGFLRQHRPMNLVAPSPSPSSYFTVPPGLSPTGLLNSPVFFSPLQELLQMHHCRVHRSEAR